MNISCGLGKYIINLSNTSTKFEKYDTINNVKKLILFGKYELPIEFYINKNEELSLDEISYTKEQAESVAKARVLNTALNALPKDAEVLTSEYNVFDNGTEVIVRVTIECLEPIGLLKEIKRDVM